jgi:hypothetical protein
MKKLFILLIIAFWIIKFSNAQHITDVIEIKEKNADQLYLATKEWFAFTFNSSQDVIQLDDSVKKEIIAKGIKTLNSLSVNLSYPYKYHFNFFIQFRDGRYKYDIEITEITQSDNRYSYLELKSISTYDGLVSYYKSKGIRVKVLGEKLIHQHANLHAEVLNSLTKDLEKIHDDLFNYISKRTIDDDW